MGNIIISRGDVRISMPRTRTLVVGGEPVCKEIKMASGKMIMEMIGFRKSLKADWNWLPAQTITDLHRLLRQGGYFDVQYPDPVAGAVNGMFSVSYPETGIFKFEQGVPRWKDISLTMTAQEVE